MLCSTPGWLQTAHLQKVRVQKHRWWRPLLWAGLLALSFMLAWQVVTSGALLAADAVALSDPWRFVDESKPGSPLATGDLATTAAEAPTQVAARFNISSTMQALALQLYDAELGGLPLAQVDELGYCTRLVDGPRPYAVMLQLNIDADVTDGDNSWQGRLVYTPSYNGAVIQGEWQCWNTLVGKWWATGGPVADHATAASPLPLGTLLAHFPNLGINATYSVVALKAGDGWSNFQGEASPVVIGVEDERINIAFGTAPQDNVDGNSVLLPVLLNEPQDKPQDKPQAISKNNNNKEKKEPKNQRIAVDWGDVNLANFDWESFDWDKVDWEHIDWEAFGWGGDERAEVVRAFVDDVKQCQEKGWEEMGFHDAGACVAYYAKEHTPAHLAPAHLDWNVFEWGNSWNDDDNQNERNRSGRRD
jgi:hypothetical protein